MTNYELGSNTLTPSRLTLVSPSGQRAAVCLRLSALRSGCLGSRHSPRLTDTAPQLFAGEEMGEDALRVLNDYRKLLARISTDVKAELPHVRAAVAWSKRV